eukprot:CAMPEP_0173088664 /NCGR_PEP_ID=MMETSP1102-20130122/25156_1 /TAXON_ID=49646 /ORGANISM="Geminigera sp., Strain Caron Lab Isolate" /LENGTH=271 /DNA_ID=CAMNT_0013971785 /DNA_START=204 /DNA_END=1019 /DNA_ORIENTATION=-
MCDTVLKKLYPHPQTAGSKRMLTLSQVGGKETPSKIHNGVATAHHSQIHSRSQLAQPQEGSALDLFGSLGSGWASVVSDVETHGKNVWTSVALLLPPPENGKSIGQALPDSRPLYTSNSDAPALPLSRSVLAARRGVRENNRQRKNSDISQDERATATLPKSKRWTSSALPPSISCTSCLPLEVETFDTETLSKIHRWISSAQPALERRSSLPISKNDTQWQAEMQTHNQTQQSGHLLAKPMQHRIPFGFRVRGPQRHHRINAPVQNALVV